MSSMLEQAIIDANALRESAIKNAEAMIIEKYSSQIKEAVSSILEADEDEEMNTDSSFDEIPTAMAEDLPNDIESEVSDDDTPITINLPELKQRIEDYEDKMGEKPEPDVTSDELAADLEPAIDAAPPESVDSPMLEDSHDEEDLEEGGAAQKHDNLDRLRRQDPDRLKEEEDKDDLDEDFDLEQAIVDEIMEKLNVDIDPQMSGYINRPESEMKEIEDMELARRRDSDVAEEMEGLKSTIKDLEESIKLQKSKTNKLAQENKKYIDAILLLKEKVELVNVSNAKLLYINKSLESDSLNERQRRKLVEAISKAETPKEAKVIYETLQSTVGSTEAPSVPKSLSEAVSRNSSLILNAHRKENKNENDIFSERMQRLAGIKTKN